MYHRNISIEERVQWERIYRPYQMTHDASLDVANYQIYFTDNFYPEYSAARLQYERLFHHTRAFAENIQHLVAAASNAEMAESWATIAVLVVEFSTSLLQVDGLHLEKFLISQHASIYHILDDALLRLCIAEWESSANSASWIDITKPIITALVAGLGKLDEWHEPQTDKPAIAKDAIKRGYFKRSKVFLGESSRIFRVRKGFSDCEKGRLPVELVEVIVEDLLRYEGLPTGRLRPLYIPSGKGKV